MADDLVQSALDKFKVSKAAWKDIYRKSKEDIRFLSDEPFAQWEESEASKRTKTNRPALTVDQLSQFVHQVENDIRMNTPNINVAPDNSDADSDTATIFEGIIKGIEYKSKADAAYDNAASFSVRGSIGYIRVDNDYANDEGFEQELQIKRVINPSAVFPDADSIEPDGSDFKYCFVLDEMKVSDFKKSYKGKTPVSFSEEEVTKELKDEDTITIAEYFYVSESTKSMGYNEGAEPEEVIKVKTYKQQRDVTKKIVHRCKLSGEDVLEETTFPGKYIPIVPVYGEEVWIDGKRHLYSLIRKSKDAQKRYNYWISLETELLLKAPKAPVMAAVGQIEDFQADWQDPDKAMALRYKQVDVDGKPAPVPQRLQPPTIPTGIINAARESIDDIRATLGMYNASLGEKSNVISGIAYNSQKKEGDVATFHFGDNLNRSIAQVGKILVFAIPEIIDTPRLIKIIGKEEEAEMIGVNGMLADGQKQSYDLTKGKYDVRVITGAAFTTQRQEAANFFSQIISQQPELMPVAGDLMFKYMDFPGAQALSARMKKLVDPKLLDEKDQQDIQSQQNPEVLKLQAQLQQVTAQAQQEIQALQAELKNKQGDQQVKMADVQVKAEEVAIKKQEVDIKAGELKLKYIEAAKEPQTTSQPAEQPNPNDSIEALHTQLQNKISAQQKAAQQEEDEKLRQQQEAAAKAQREQDENQLKALELRQREQQGQAVIQVLGGISQQLHNLTTQVSQPLKVMRDDAGNITGAE